MRLREDDAAAVIGQGIVRVESDRLREIGNCALMVTFLLVGNSTVAMSTSISWIEPNCFCQVLDGLVKVAYLPMRHSAVGKRTGMLRVESNCFREVCDRLVEMALLLVYPTTIVVSRRVAGNRVGAPR